MAFLDQLKATACSIRDESKREKADFGVSVLVLETMAKFAFEGIFRKTIVALDGEKSILETVYQLISQPMGGSIPSQEVGLGLCLFSYDEGGSCLLLSSCSPVLVKAWLACTWYTYRLSSKGVSARS